MELISNYCAFIGNIDAGKDENGTFDFTMVLLDFVEDSEGLVRTSDFRTSIKDRYEAAGFKVAKAKGLVVTKGDVRQVIVFD